MQWMDGEVPTPDGNIKVYCSTNKIKVSGAAGTGTLRIKSVIKPSVNKGKIISLGKNLYELKIENGQEYSINYKAI